MANLNAIFQGGFDATTVAPDTGRDFAPLPAGLYDVEISNSEVKDTKAGNGCYLALELTVLGPTASGRKVWSNITLRNNSEKAQSIGQAQLSALCHAVGIQRLQDSDELFQKTLRVRLTVKPESNGYPARNEVSGYEALGQSRPAMSPAASRPAANAAPAAAAGGATPPWARK